MEQNPDLSGTEVTERPKNTTLEGTVVNVVKGTRKEIYPETDPENLKYGEMDDELIQLEIDVEYQGTTLTVYESMSFYENPSDQSMFGAYIQRYGHPKPDQEISVDFDHEGQATVNGIRN